MNSKGVYKRLNDGPNSKCWIEIETKKGDSTGKHLQVCDGTYLHIFKQLLNDEMLESIKVKEIYALFDEREIPAVELKNLRTMFEGNFVPNPEAMLRGYRGSIDFKTITKNQTVGGRSTTMVEGHWNKAALTRMTKGATANPTIESLPAGQAQYIRVFLDDETGWPLRAELFFRNKELEMTPVYIIEFKEIKFPPTLADSEFKYEVPTKEKNPKVNIQDMTVRIKSMLQQNLGKYKPKAGATTTDNVSGPITLGGNKMDEKKQDAPAAKKKKSLLRRSSKPNEPSSNLQTQGVVRWFSSHDASHNLRAACIVTLDIPRVHVAPAPLVISQSIPSVLSIQLFK